MGKQKAKKVIALALRKMILNRNDAAYFDSDDFILLIKAGKGEKEKEREWEGRWREETTQTGLQASFPAV